MRETKTVFFPLQWTRSCISLDSAGRKVALVVDGQLVVIMIVVMILIAVVFVVVSVVVLVISMGMTMVVNVMLIVKVPNHN